MKESKIKIKEFIFFYLNKGNNKKKFEHLLNVATVLSKDNPRALPDFVRIIMRPYQFESLLAVAERGADAINNIDCKELFGKFIFDYIWSDAGGISKINLPNQDYLVKLNKHIVLPWPWDLNRYIDCLSFIGSEKYGPYAGKDIEHFDLGKAPWVQDYNHQICVWLPWGIGFVYSGNHSIMTGISAGEGEIIPEEVHDYSYLLKLIYTDGIWWYDKKSKNKLSRVKDYRFAAVFEIGRLMNRYNCGADISMIKT